MFVSPITSGVKNEQLDKQNRSIRKRQLLYNLTDMWKLRTKAEDHRGREEKMKQDETRETP